MRLIYHPEAEAELIEAAQFYERRATGLGARFLNTIDQCVEQLVRAPQRWRILRSDVRRSLVLRFPYGILYRSLPDELRILAIAHLSRHPDYWLDRLSD